MIDVKPLADGDSAVDGSSGLTRAAGGLGAALGVSPNVRLERMLGAAIR